MFTVTTVTIDRIRELRRRAKPLIHEHGLLFFLRQLFIWENHFNIYENNLDGPRFPCKVDNLTLRVITCPEELDQLSAQGFNFSEFIKTITSRETVFLAFVGKEIVHRSYFVMRKEGVSIYFCSSFMDDGDTAYIRWIWTAPKYRRKGISAFVLSEIFRYLRDKGMSRAITVVSKGNIAQENCQLKVGSYLWGEGCYRRLLVLCFWWVKSKSRVTCG